MFRKIGDWFRQLMYGRYGSDRLNLMILIIAMICSVLSSFVSSLSFLVLASYILIIYAFFRMFSRNIAARQREAGAYNRFLKFFTDRNNRYFDCPSCGQTVRVPRRKGKISIHCPRCGMRFEKKT